MFALTAANGEAVNPADPPVAVFTMHPEEPAPISVVTVTPRANGEEAEVVDLRQPDSAYTAPYMGTAPPATDETAAEQNGHGPPTASSDGELVVEQTSSDGGPTGQINGTLLAQLVASPEYQGLRDRLARSEPTESWEEDGLHFFVFQLLPINSNGHIPTEAPAAVFTMHPDESAPVSVVVVTPGADGEEAEIVDLRNPDSAYSAPYVQANGKADASGG